LRHGSTGSHPVEFTRGGDGTTSHRVPPSAYGTPEVPAPVLRPGERFLTPAEVAALLKVSRATVYGFIERGELRAVRVGLQLRVAPTDVQALLRSR
jgi:excisionase family DNA binding protein